MKRTVAKVTCKGTYRIIYDDSKLYRPYTIYRETYSDGKKHSGKIESCVDLASCMFYLGERILEREYSW